MTEHDRLTGASFPSRARLGHWIALCAACGLTALLVAWLAWRPGQSLPLAGEIERLGGVFDSSVSPRTDVPVILQRVIPGERSTSIHLDDARIDDRWLASRSAELARLGYIHEIVLNDTPITDAGLARMPEAFSLSLAHTGVTDAGITQLAKRQGLYQLNLHGTQCGDESVAALAGSLHLLHLAAGRETTDASVEHLDAFLGLRSLSLAGTLVSDAGLRRVTQLNLPELARLGLGGPNMSEAGLESLQHFPKLRSVGLIEEPFGDTSLAWLSELPRLHTVALAGPGFTDAFLDHWKPSEALEVLILVRTGVTDAGLVRVVELPRLDTLSVAGSPVSDAGLKQISSMSLGVLELSETRVTDAGMAHVAMHRRLRALGLQGTDVSDAGLDSLHELEDLVWLDLRQTRVTEAGVARLTRALPKCTIRFLRDR